MKITVAVVILNWNGKTLLEKFLPSVITHSENAQIVVADNGSSDDSVAYLTNTYPEVKIISLPENMGFCKGYNTALAEVDADIFILLNSDVEVPAGWLMPMIQLLEKDQTVAACQPKIKDFKRKNYFEYAGAAGGFIDTLGYPFCRGRIFDHIEEDKGQYNTDIEIFWASGACMAIRASVFKETGGFDETFFAHMEEIDLCWRISNLGYKIYCCTSSEVYHVGGASLDKSNPRKTYLNFRNNFMMLLKNLDTRSYLSTIPLRLVLDGIAGIKFLAEGKLKHCLAIIQAHFYCYLNLNRIRTKGIKGKGRLKYKSGVYKGSIVKAYFANNISAFKNLKF